MVSKSSRRAIPCPTCKKEAIWSEQNPWRPFCSERCRLVDLGAWAGEKHYIPGEERLDKDAIENMYPEK
ncbi:DNA gyrase inhibitor YacG [Candidatus Nitrosacidococcus tergens]|uniref:DNA gyrase inhibitor YacG n=1 Tax=Candidatus Nitrosacidococcus tergens TaxID=553981 RepID=A0A7G1Q781_9GAMM